jgi:2-desacetyl-2-hydroxyethyl bacteriochlorophyllide A dehydrogenase
MWTSTLELDAAHVIPTRLLGRLWRGAFFSSFAPLQVRNLPRHTLPEAHWVRVRNILAGICGNDLHLIFGDGDFRIAPAALQNNTYSYPGHEVLGEVIEVGDDVSLVHVGDRVVLQHGPNCATSGIQPLCRSCAAGNYTLCQHGFLHGPQPIGGGWSEEMLLHEQQLFCVPPTLNDEQAVLLEPTAVAVHAVLRRLPQTNERVLVIGAGTIGLLIVQVIRALAPQTEISVVARHAFQVEQATRMGAAHIIYPQDRYQSVQRITGAELHRGILGNSMLLGGFDVIYDTIGNQRTTQDSLRWTCADGTIVMVGEHLHAMHVDLTPVWFQEVNLIGALGHGNETWPLGSNKQQSTFAIAAELIEQAALRPEQLITHRFALTNYRDALSTATHKAESRALKVIFDYALLPPSVVPNVRASRQHRPLSVPQTGHAAAAQPSQLPLDEPTNAYPQDDSEEIEELTVPFARQPRVPEPIVMPIIPIMPAIPPTPLSPVLSDMVPPPILNDDDESQTVVVSQPPEAQPAPGSIEEDTQTALPVIAAQSPLATPTPADERQEETTTVFVAAKSKRSRQRRSTTTSAIANTPSENAVETANSEHDTPNPDNTLITLTGPSETLDEYTIPSYYSPSPKQDVSPGEDAQRVPSSLSPSWMDTLQARQESPGDIPDIPQWLSSLRGSGQETEGTAETAKAAEKIEKVEAEKMEGPGLQQPVMAEEKSTVTNDTSSTLLPVEGPSVPIKHLSPSIQPEDERGTSQGV